MYRLIKEKHISPQDFEIPRDKKLNPHNKWVILAELIPWQKFEAEYAANFEEKMGAPAKSFRIALGSLIIQEISGYTDRQVIENIEENPYLQYFLGQKILTTFILLFFELLIIKFNNKIYPTNNLKKTYSLDYKETKLLLYQFVVISLKTCHKLSK